jgi:hypothetical protein
MRILIKCTLTEIHDPVVWRKLAIPLEITFHELHLILQGAMGWENQHLYSFGESKASRFFRVVSPYAEEFGMDGSRISVSNVLWEYMNQFSLGDEPKEKMYYEYDFGDSWGHEIDVLDQDRSNKTAAELLDGAGACPPENCGGVSGYARTKEYLAGKISKEEYYDWFSAADAEGFDPHAFDLAKMQRRVKRWKEMRG